MKLNVPINPPHSAKGQYAEGYIEGFKDCLDELSQCEAVFDEEKLARHMWEHDTVRRIEASWPWEEEEQKWYLAKAKLIIAALPSIMSIKKGS